MEKQESTPIHEQFSAQDADITIQSSDGVLFKLHRQNLGAITGAFPGPEIDTQGEIVQLTEPANVLNIVFQFIYPRRHPNLKGLDFDTMMEVAEAVEKYQIFSAMNTCEVRLNEFMSGNPARILAYAIKHDYTDFGNKAAYLLARRPPLEAVGVLPSHCAVPWLNYQGAWDKVFDDGVYHVERLSPSSSHSCTQSMNVNGQAVAVYICHRCQASLLAWILELRQIRATPALMAAITDPTFPIYVGAVAPQLCDYCEESICIPGIQSLKKVIEDGIAAIPPFNQFLVVKAKVATS